MHSNIDPSANTTPDTPQTTATMAVEADALGTFVVTSFSVAGHVLMLLLLAAFFVYEAVAIWTWLKKRLAEFRKESGAGAGGERK